MADLVTRLRLENKQFDDNIKKSKSQIDSMKSTGTKIGSELTSVLTGSFGKIAGVIGIAGGAFQTFEAIMNSNQTTSDTYANVMAGLTDTVDNFFRSLATGDWSAFNEGILGSYRNAFDLSIMLDELADKQLALSFTRSEDLADYESWNAIARDTTKTYEERLNAVQNMEGLTNRMRKMTEETVDLELKTINKKYANKSGLSFTTEDITYFAKNTNFIGKLTGEAASAYKRYVELRNQLNKEKKNYLYDLSNYGKDDSRTIQKRYNLLLKEVQDFKKENNFLIKQGFLAEEDDEGRKKTYESLINAERQRREIAGLDKRNVRVRNALKDKPLDNKGSDVDTVIPPQSIAAIKRHISDLKKSYENATSDGMRAGIKEAIAEAETQLAMLEARAAGTDLISDKIEKPKGKSIAGDLASGKIKIRGAKKGSLNPFDKKDIKNNEKYADTLNGIATVMGAVTNMTNEGAAAWLSWGTNLLTSIAAAIPAITALTAAKKGEAAANAVASATQTPIVGWLLAGAAVAAVVGALMSIPKFATGGIVGGNSFYGDKVPAMLNSGEMVLNSRQQSNLFDLLNNGTVGNIPQKELKVKISGKDLVGVLSNYNNRMNKLI